jgi:Reverse transcriptase (RNA-dependent DNA polymerase)
MLAGWKGYVVDAKGAFLNGRFDKGEELFLKIPQGFEQFYKELQVLKLNRTIYCLKQAAQAFWTELTRALMAMVFVGSDGDPCCYYKNVSGQKIVYLPLVDDCIFFGSIPNIIREKNRMMEYFECEDVGFVKEYIGCKVKMNEKERSVKFMQHFLVKSLVDEFGAGSKHVNTPAPAGQCLQAGSAEDIIPENEKKKFQAGVGKLLYPTRWSRPEIGNLVTMFSLKPQSCHQSAIEILMSFCVCYKDNGWTLKPTGIWNENDEENEVNIVGVLDSDYSKVIKTRRSVTGYIVFLNGAPVAAKSKMQGAVTLSVTEAELVAATHCYQEMLYVKKVLESIKISVKMPMVLQMDNKGAKDLINNWSIGGWTHYIDVCYLFFVKRRRRTW